ncbi:DUF2683 family protein [Candidatus Woesearchaeota archaeon]|nr:DUF2683 family protein [Candidatus Woesearchaeota archaeon]
MVQAMINVEENTNRVLNVVKAKYGLKDKSQAIDLVVAEYEQSILEPQLRPEYIEKLKAIDQKGKFRKFASLTQLRKAIEHA